MLSTRALVTIGLVSVVALAGCATTAEDKNGDVIASDAAELKSSLVSYLGPIADGETKSLSYSTPPKFRAYGFSAKGGDTIVLDVKSNSGGDAMAWLTTSSYSSLAFNDDASSQTLDAHIEYTVPAGQAKRSYRIVFRDYDLLSATFSVTSAIRGSTVGSSPKPSCDPAQEPRRLYKGTPTTCQVIRYTCPAGHAPFENDCGCGCE